MEIESIGSMMGQSEMGFKVTPCRYFTPYLVMYFNKIQNCNFALDVFLVLVNCIEN
jgi:hypothetical protein